jgi:HEAT repeat protein
MRKLNCVSSVTAGLVLGALVLAPSESRAGRGGSPQLISRAIASNSVDAIAAELERSERLVCASCTTMVLPLVDHGDYRVRKVAAWWLVRRGISRQVYLDMLQRFAQPDSVKARNAADVLGEFGFAQAVPPLSAALSNPVYSPEARAAMARALGSIARPTAVPALTGALSASEPQVKSAALMALREINGFKDARVATPLLTDADAGVRAQAVLTFGALRSRDGVDGLLRVLQTDASVNVRKKAAWALGEVGAPAATAGPALQRAASADESPQVRSLARIAISKLTR